MSAYKKLNQQDSYISNYTSRKSWIASGSQYRELGIQNIVGLSSTGVYLTSDSDNVYGGNVANSGSTEYNRRLVFESNKHLYYKMFENSLLLTSSSYENYLQSSYNVSGSRYLDNRVSIISIPKEIYGTHIEPNSVTIQPDYAQGTTAAGSLDNYVINNYATDAGVDSVTPSLNLYVENTNDMYGTSTANLSVDYIENESTYVDEADPTPGQYLGILNNQNQGNIIKDDGEGNLYFNNTSPRRYVGNVIYPHGQIIITDEAVAIYYNHYFDAVIKWKSNLPIYTHNYHCRLKANEFNHTLNRTALDGEDGKISDIITGSAFHPYFTTVGLYNDSNDLIAVAKMGRSVPKSNDTDMVVVVKLDMNFGSDRLLGGRTEKIGNTGTPVYGTTTLVSTQYYTVQTRVNRTGKSIGRDEETADQPKRIKTDSGAYGLWRKNKPHTSGVEIPNRGDFPGHTNDVQFIQRDSTVSHNSTPCYVDVIVKKYQTPNGSINYDFDFGDYLANAVDTGSYPTPTNTERTTKGRKLRNRSKAFFTDIIQDYLLTGEVADEFPLP